MLPTFALDDQRDAHEAGESELPDELEVPLAAGRAAQEVLVDHVGEPDRPSTITAAPGWLLSRAGA